MSTSIPSRSAGFATAAALALTVTSAMAQPATQTVGGALGAPSQAKVAAPAAAPTVKAGAGGGPTAAPASATIQVGDLAVDAEQFRAAFPNAVTDPDVAKAQRYDRTQQVQVRGTISRVMWINPSAIIFVTDGQGREWAVENTTPNTLLRNGVNRDVLAVGTEITLSGHPSRDPACPDQCHAEGVNLTLKDGTVFSLASQGAAPAPPPQ